MVSQCLKYKLCNIISDFNKPGSFLYDELKFIHGLNKTDIIQCLFWNKA
ncbi:hypothetical protein DSUL_60222 [Desulfovibrionales bacterium]